jgi:hypothetical protein
MIGRQSRVDKKAHGSGGYRIKSARPSVVLDDDAIFYTGEPEYFKHLLVDVGEYEFAVSLLNIIDKFDQIAQKNGRDMGDISETKNKVRIVAHISY